MIRRAYEKNKKNREQINQENCKNLIIIGNNYYVNNNYKWQVY